MQLVVATAVALVMAILAAGTVGWVRAALKLAAGQPLVPWRPRRSVPWGMLDLFGILALYVVVSLLVAAALKQFDWLPAIDDEAQLTLADKGLLVWLDSGIKVALLIVAIPLVALKTGAGARDFGLWLGELAADLKLGVIGFVMLAPPVYAIQGLLVYLWKPSKHPLMEMFKSSPDAGFFAVLLLAASIIAPIFEEFVFRVLLQGFLEKLINFRGHVLELLIGRLPGGMLPATAPPVAEPAVLIPPPDASTNPYSPPAIVADVPAVAGIADDAAQQELCGAGAWLPIAAASVIFALLHYSHGPDWVPLIALSFGMGYLYQRTHSLVPSLVVHTLLNSLSMFGLWIQVYAFPES